MTALFKDLRLAIRVLLRTKSWTAVVLVSLALGIGANTALFTAVNGMLLQTVNVKDPGQLVRFNYAGQNDMVRSSSDYGYSGVVGTRNIRSTFSYPMFQQLRAANKTLTDLAAGSPFVSFNVIIKGDAQLATTYEASGGYFKVLGVPAMIGRVFGESDDTVTASPVAVISYPYWKKRFGGDPSVINRVVSMSGQMVTVIGVTPPDFSGIQKLGGAPPDVTVPLAFDAVFSPPSPSPQKDAPPPVPRVTQPTNWWLQLVGRLKPGVTVDAAHANFATVFENTARAGMAEFQSSLKADEKKLTTNRPRGSAVPDLLVKSAAHGYYDVDPQSTRSAGFLSAVVIIVLLIVCANVANLLLARATTRHREIAVRLSMGATRGRLIRQLLTESLVLSGLGGILGVLVGYWSRGLLPFGQTAPLDWRVFGFVTAVSVLTGVLFGLVPALRATRVDLSSAMKESSRSVTSSRSILSKGLLVLQVAMSLVLLIGAGLFLRTLENLKTVDVGFDSQNLLTFNVNPAVNNYDADRSAALFRQVLDRMSALPGVKSVALTRMIFLSGSMSSSSMWKQGQTSEAAAEDNMYMMDISPTFFATMGIPVQMGRAFTDHDDTVAPKVALLNEAAARKLFPEGGALGRRIGGSFEKSDEFEIIGVVRDTKYASVRDPGPPTMYRCLNQYPMRSSNVVVRTQGDPLAMTETVRAAMREVDPALPIQRFTSQTEQISQRFSQERLFATAYSAFGVLALALACIGLFGLMSYNVSRRTNEIGIRMALGAQRSTIVGMVMGESLLLVGIGVAIGLGTAVGAGRFVKTVVFGVSPTDALTIGGAVILIAVVAAIAGYLPARRAAEVDPMVALHQQ
jgi:predicted permease